MAMCNENKDDFNENFRTYSQEPIAHLDKKRPVGADVSQLQF